MKSITTIAAKELKSYFISPIAYVIATVFLIITGYIFYSNLYGFSLECFKAARFPEALKKLNINLYVFNRNFGAMMTTIMYMMPIMTMRIFAEEKKNKTMELLMTSPVSIFEIVLGKFLASFLLYAGIVFLTIYMPIYVSRLHFTSGSFDWGPIFIGYIGVLLLGSLFLSIGIFASSLTENQIVAAMISFAFILIFVLIDIAAQMVEGKIAAVLNYLSLVTHSRSFFMGVIDTKDVIFYLSFIAFGLFMTFRVIESKRWTQ